MGVDRSSLATVFKCFDLDHSGGISLEELQSAVVTLGIPNCPKSKVAKMFFDADIDGSGEIDFDEVP